MKKLVKLLMILLTITPTLYSFDIKEDKVIFQKSEFIKLSDNIKSMQSDNKRYKLELKDIKKAIQNEREASTELINHYKEQIHTLKQINKGMDTMIKEERKYSKGIEDEKDKLIKLKEDNIKNLNNKILLERVKFSLIGVVTGILLDQILIK